MTPPMSNGLAAYHADRRPDAGLGPNQITDAYLLALAVKNGGRLATFDRSITLGAVRRAKPRHLAVI